MPAATAAAAPLLEPPGVLAKSQGLWQSPYKYESVTFFKPNSGALVVPIGIRPIFLACLMKLESRVATLSLNKRAAPLLDNPCASGPSTFTGTGKPANKLSSRLLCSYSAWAKAGLKLVKAS